MSIQLKAASGAICTLSLSFNNDGPLGTFFRYIGDTGTYLARYDDLYDGKDQKIDVSQVAVSMNGIELQDREFFAAIREGREPNASVAQVLPCYERSFTISSSSSPAAISQPIPPTEGDTTCRSPPASNSGAIAGTVALGAMSRAWAQDTTLRVHQMLPPQATIPRARPSSPGRNKVDEESRRPHQGRALSRRCNSAARRRTLSTRPRTAWSTSSGPCWATRRAASPNPKSSSCRSCSDRPRPARCAFQKYVESSRWTSSRTSS